MPDPIDPIDNPQGLLPDEVDVPEEPIVTEPSLNMIGFLLSKIVLWIIIGSIILIMFLIFFKEFSPSHADQAFKGINVSDSTFNRKVELLKLMQEDKKSSRDFIMQVAQMILLNLLLPVLTAILGYIFASNKNKE